MKNLITVLVLLVATVAFGQREQRKIDVPGVDSLAVGDMYTVEMIDTSPEAYIELVADVQGILYKNDKEYNNPDINDSNTDYTAMSFNGTYDDIQNGAGEFAQVWILEYTEEYHVAMSLHMSKEEMYMMVWVNVH